MEPKINLISEDARGASWAIVLPDNREVLLIYSREGSLRGGHSHSKDEVSLLLTGKAKTWKIINGEEKTFEYSAGDIIRNKADEPHLTLAVEDFWLIDFKPNTKIGESVNTNFPPYREKITT